MEIDPQRLYPITSPTQFANIILPDESFFDDGDQMNFTAEYREMIDRVRSFAAKNRTLSAAKVYYFYGNVQIGEERLAEYFRAKGYEIVSPEKLSTDEQLNVLINADSFASTLGSCSHNSIFLRDGAEVILIPRVGKRLTGFQQTLDQVHPLNVAYVDSSLSIFNKRNGPYCFIISDRLKNFFGDDFSGYDEDDYKIFLEYVRYSLSRGFEMNAEVMTYCSPMYDGFIDGLRRRTDLLEAYGVNLN